MGIVETIQNLPRAARWGLYAAAFMLVYFAAIEPTIARVQDMNERAETVAADLEELERQLRERESNMASLSKGLQEHGPVLAPAPADVRTDQVYDLLIDVTSELGILSGWRFEPGELGLQSPSLEQEFLAPGEELVRLTFNFSFEASPEDVMEAIARFEESPAVQSIRSIRIRLGPDESRTLAVQLVLESWAIRTRGGRS